jgi:hypothetical protein
MNEPLNHSPAGDVPSNKPTTPFIRPQGKLDGISHPTLLVKSCLAEKMASAQGPVLPAGGGLTRYFQIQTCQTDFQLFTLGGDKGV